MRDGLNWYAYCGNNPVAFKDPFGTEKIVISGGVYSNKKKTEGKFYYEFIEPAIKKLREFKEMNSNESITWLIASSGWDYEEKRQFEDVASDIGVGIKFIGNKNTLIDYINNKYEANKKTRHLDRITNFVVFSHGFLIDSGVVSLGYNYIDDNYNTSLDIYKSDIINSIYATAFNNPISYFYSCNTGTAGDNSFAQTWVNKFKGVTYAFSGKSDYGSIGNGFHPLDVLSRKLHNFSYYGSANYPVADVGASFLAFLPK